MTDFDVEIFRKSMKWVVTLNGGVVARAFTLKGVQRRVDIATSLIVLRGGKGTL